jgi:predicted nucleotidyltransferase component of viral defense system
VIPLDFITEWRQRAPWVQDAQVEQDLVICRALVTVLGPEVAGEALAFRGGTALHRLHLAPPARYSEDIDLVQVSAGPIGPTLNAIRQALDPWLGDPKWAQKESSVSLVYRVQSEGPPSLPMRIKIEINSQEHFTVLGFEERRFAMESRWFSGSTSIRTYHLDELLGTKLRALYQRKKGRDLFDLWLAQRRAVVDAEGVVRCFSQYMGHSGLAVSRAEFEKNLAEKLTDTRFLDDITPLLAPGCPWDVREAGRYVRDELIAHLPGSPWKGATGRGDASE